MPDVGALYRIRATIGWEGLILEEALIEESKTSKKSKKSNLGRGEETGHEVLEYHSSDVDAQ